MKLQNGQTINADVLVIGSGGAGLRAAIEAKKHNLNVVLLSESPVGLRNNSAISSTGLAVTGIAKEPGDSANVHLKDTITAGRFINDRGIVRVMSDRARQQVYDLMRFGVNFRKQDGEILVRQLAGHTYPRSVYVEGFKGVNLTGPMRKHATSMGIQFMEGISVTKLLRADNMVGGAVGIDGKGQLFILKAKATVLATGGAGHLYSRTDNAEGLTGDGYALAYEVGAGLRDMEFVQFYPTAWGEHGSKMVFYERFMARGAVIRNSLEEDILKIQGINSSALLTRDVLTLTIMKEVMAGRGIGGQVLFDLSTIPEEKVQELYSMGLMQKGDYPEKMPVAPTVHFFMGGVKINENAETGINGLYAAGEVCGGLHGANRLADNAIIETLVFGAIAGNRASTRASQIGQIPTFGSEVKAEVERLNQLASGSSRESPYLLQQSLKRIMWDKAGVVRNKQNLEEALGEIVALREQLEITLLTDYRQLSQGIKLANMLTVAEMLCRAALIRTESRGAHYRDDHPEEDNAQWLKVVEIDCQSGQMTLRVWPVPVED